MYCFNTVFLRKGTIAFLQIDNQSEINKISNLMKRLVQVLQQLSLNIYKFLRQE